MIGALLLAIAQPQPAPDVGVGEAEAEEIVVIGRRARGVRWDWKVDKAGRLTKCKVTKSSGDREIDRIGCEATRRCAARGIRKAGAMRDCVIPVRTELIAELADRRVAERNNAGK
jgi:TonB family protein